MTMSLLLQIVAAYLATSVTVGLTLGVALGAMIRRADRQHQQHIALLMRSRTSHDVRPAAEQTARGAVTATRGHVDQSSPAELRHAPPGISYRQTPGAQPDRLTARTVTIRDTPRDGARPARRESGSPHLR